MYVYLYITSQRPSAGQLLAESGVGLKATALKGMYVYVYHEQIEV